MAIAFEEVLPWLLSTQEWRAGALIRGLLEAYRVVWHVYANRDQLVVRSSVSFMGNCYRGEVSHPGARQAFTWRMPCTGIGGIDVGQVCGTGGTTSPNSREPL